MTSNKKTISELVNKNMFCDSGNSEHIATIVKRILRGINGLNLHLDGWYNKINLYKLNIMSNIDCICGQLGISNEELLSWINEEYHDQFYYPIDENQDENGERYLNTLKLHEYHAFYLEFSDRFNMNMKNGMDGLTDVWSMIIENFQNCSDLISFE